MEVFHCYEFLLMKRFQEDKMLWDGMKSESRDTSNFQSHLLSMQNQDFMDVDCYLQNESFTEHLSADLWFLAVAMEKAPYRIRSFLLAELQKDEQHITRVPGETVLSRYLSHYSFVEMHLDSVFKYGEKAVLPRELFKCKNVRILSLKYNNLEVLPADIGRLSNLECLSLTNNRLQNRCIPFTLTFCKKLKELYLDNNLLDALPGLLLAMPQLTTVHRHGNHNYFKATFMWYHTHFNDRVLNVCGIVGKKKARLTQNVSNPSSLQVLAAKSVIASKINFFLPGLLPNSMQNLIADIYRDYNLCDNCQKASSISKAGFKVYTFKNPYLGNTCVPFQHWACSRSCAEDIDIPAHLEQQRAAKRMDQEYSHYIQGYEKSLLQGPATPVSKTLCNIL